MILKKHFLEFWYQRLPARIGWKSLGAAKSTICRYSLWRICSENSQKWLNGWVQFRKNIDLPRISHVNFYNEIRILSAICALTTRWVTLPPPPCFESIENVKGVRLQLTLATPELSSHMGQSQPPLWSGTSRACGPYLHIGKKLISVGNINISTKKIDRL